MTSTYNTQKYFEAIANSFVINVNYTRISYYGRQIDKKS